MNPWVNVPSKPPYVLEEDRPYIEAYNSTRTEGMEDWINLNHTPEPRLGPVSAAVVLLQLNPSYNKDDLYGSTDLIRKEADFESLRNENSPHVGIRHKDQWWQRSLSSLIDDVGDEKLSERICSIEFFPYRSRKFAHGHIRLPSQEYTFETLRNSLRNKAWVVVTRNLSLWICCLPELRSYSKLISTKNPRSIKISPGNLPPGEYELIRSALNEE